MKKSSEGRWSLTKSYFSAGNTSAAMTQRFFQTLRKQTNKPTHTTSNYKQKNRSFKISLTEEPRLANTTKKKEKSREIIFKQPISTERQTRVSIKNMDYSKIQRQENKIYRLKQKFQQVLRKKNCLSKMSNVTPAEISIAINGMGILSFSNKHFNELKDSIEEMMKVASRTLSVVNLFVILLGFQNIEVTQKQLDWIKFSEQNRKQLIKLTKPQINQMYQMYVQLNTSNSTPISLRTQAPLIISITLPNRQKQENLFSGRESFRDIAGSLMSKYNIPQKKRKNMERIIFSKLNQKGPK